MISTDIKLEADDRSTLELFLSIVNKVVLVLNNNCYLLIPYDCDCFLAQICVLKSTNIMRVLTIRLQLFFRNTSAYL